MGRKSSQEATRRNLLKAAIALFAEKGLAGATTAEVSKQAGVATGTLFNHFPSKDALIEAVFLELKSTLAERMRREAELEGDPRRLLQSVWRAYLLWALDHPAERAVLRRLKTYPGLSETARAQGDDAFAFATSAMVKGLGEEQAAVWPPDLAEMIFASVAEGTIDYLESRGGFDPQVADQAFLRIWNSLVGQP